MKIYAVFENQPINLCVLHILYEYTSNYMWLIIRTKCFFKSKKCATKIVTKKFGFSTKKKFF